LKRNKAWKKFIKSGTPNLTSRFCKVGPTTNLKNWEGNSRMQGKSERITIKMA
jgi:hypothetical protein